MNGAIIVTAGSSVRMGGRNKTFLRFFQEPAIFWALLPFENHPQIGQIVLVGKKEDLKKLKNLLKRKKFKKVKAVVAGGATRQASVLAGLKTGQGLGWQAKDLVCIQDGARILVREKEITPALRTAKIFGGAVVGVPVKDTIHLVKKGNFLAGTPKRESLLAAQTPQVLRFEVALSAFEKAQKEGRLFTDDVSLARYYHPEIQIKITPGSYENLKITTPEDLGTAKNILKERLCFQEKKPKE